ncbi:MAG: hypothetical protein ABSH19_02870, partial [Opitutales bacterium]
MTCRSTLCRFLAWAICGLQPAVAFAGTEPGLIYVHTARGDITVQDSPAGPVTSLARGAAFAAVGQIVTVPDAHPLVLVLSNGSALCLPDGGQITLKSFTQEPVVDTSTDRDYEPTPSQLKLSLAQGSLALAMRTPKPTSTLDIATTFAQLSCLSRSLVVIATPDQVSIAVFDGTVDLTIPSTGFTETLQAGQFATLDRASLTQKYPLKLDAINLVQQQQYGAWLD